MQIEMSMVQGNEIVGPPLDSMAPKPWVFGQVYNIRHELPPIVLALIPTEEQL